MTNKTRILGILWYEFVTKVEVATLSQLQSINEAISWRRHSLFGHVRRMDQATPAHQALHLSVTSRQGSGQFGVGGDNQVVRENAGWSRSPRAQGSLLLMLGVLRRIGQHGGRYDPSSVERERERERESRHSRRNDCTAPRYLFSSQSTANDDRSKSTRPTVKRTRGTEATAAAVVPSYSSCSETTHIATCCVARRQSVISQRCQRFVLCRVEQRSAGVTKSNDPP